jgi:hypothetical protein
MTMLNTILLSDIILTTIAIIWLVTATLQDIRKREVANWLNFSLIIIGLGIRAITSIIANEKGYFINALLFLLIFFVLANILYYGRIFAGGDAKLLIALGVIFATTPSFLQHIQTLFPLQNEKYQLLQSMIIPFEAHFLITFLVNVLFLGSLYGIIYSIVLSILNRKVFLKEFRKAIRKKTFLKLIYLFPAFLFLMIAIMDKERVLLVLAVSLAALPYLFIFVKSVENSCMLRSLKPAELTEGDWLAKPLKLNAKGKKKMIIKPNWQGLSKKEINLIKKAKIKEVVIKQGIPFVPVFLIALIVSLFTNLLLFFLQFFI